MSEPTNANAMASYLANLYSAQTLAADIADVLDNHETADPETLDWGHVSDISHARGMLQEVSDSLFAEGEYAPEAK
jgi:hypothetical protein